MSAERDAVKMGIGIVEGLVEHADLPGGPLTGLIVSHALEWALDALDSHETPQLALDAMKQALSAFAQERARAKWG